MNQQHILQNLQKLKIEKKLKGMPNIERYSPLNTYLKQSSNKQTNNALLQNYARPASAATKRKDGLGSNLGMYAPTDSAFQRKAEMEKQSYLNALIEQSKQFSKDGRKTSQKPKTRQGNNTALQMYPKAEPLDTQAQMLPT